MGEEYGEDRPFLFFCSFEDSHLIENVRAGRRRDYDLVGEIPDPQAVESFERSKITWAWPEGSFQARLRTLYRDLLNARKTWPALQDFENRTARLWPDSASATLLYITRGVGEQRITAVLNLTDKPATLETPCSTAKLRLRTEAEPYANISLGQANADVIETIMPYECLIFDV
jgi:maltooligosyltrehalose trehalohydrolase